MLKLRSLSQLVIELYFKGHVKHACCQDTLVRLGDRCVLRSPKGGGISRARANLWRVGAGVEIAPRSQTGGGISLARAKLWRVEAGAEVAPRSHGSKVIMYVHYEL